MKKITIILLSIVLLSGCATRLPPASESEKRATISAMRDCFERYAEKLDDKISGAETIGRSVFRICRAASNRSIEAFTRSANNRVKAMTYESMSASNEQFATDVVLKNRQGPQ